MNHYKSSACLTERKKIGGRPSAHTDSRRISSASTVRSVDSMLYFLSLMLTWATTELRSHSLNTGFQSRVVGRGPGPVLEKSNFNCSRTLSAYLHTPLGWHSPRAHRSVLKSKAYRLHAALSTQRTSASCGKQVTCSNFRKFEFQVFQSLSCLSAETIVSSLQITLSFNLQFVGRKTLELDSKRFFIAERVLTTLQR